LEIGMGHSAKNAAVEHQRANSPGTNSPFPPPRPHRAGTGRASVVLIESDPELSFGLRQLLVHWELDALIFDLGSSLTIQDEHARADAIIADFELGVPFDRPLQLTGLDIALRISRQARRAIPTLITSSDFGRTAIRACSPHHLVVLFKPLAPDDLYRWLKKASILKKAVA
jgi:DNA-binding NtrC family response regulator